MHSTSTGKFLIITSLIVLCNIVSADLFAHGGRFKGPVTKAGIDDDPQDGQSVQGASAKGYSFPGGGPQVAFNESSWEFWWDYNQDDLIHLKPTLLKLTAQAGNVDYPFEKITQEQRTGKLVRFFSGLLRGDKSAFVREAAVISLARTRDANIVPHLRIIYEDDNDLYVRTMAVIGMGITQNPRAVPILKSIFEDGETSLEIRFYAAVAMGLAGGEAAAEVFVDWLEPQRFKGMDQKLQQAVAYGAGLTEEASLATPVRTALVNQVSDDRITSAYLILSLGHLKDRAANAILLQYLEDNRTQVRRSAAIALGAAASPSDKDVVESLTLKAQKDADNMMRNFCYIALGRIGGKEAETFLMKEVERVKHNNLPFVALGLGLTGNSEYGPRMLGQFTATRDIGAKAALALSLGLLNYKDSVGEIRKAVDSPGDPVYRGYCALALGMLGDTESVERLTRLYGSATDVELLRFAAIALGLLGDRGIARQMISLLDKTTPDLVRLSTAYNLGLIGDRKAIDPLRKIVSDPSESDQLRSFAVLGLGLLADEGAVPAVSKITRDNNYTILDNFMYELYNIN